MEKPQRRRRVLGGGETGKLSEQPCKPGSEAQGLPESEGQELGAEKRTERGAAPLGRPRGENEEENHRGMGGGGNRHARDVGDERPRTPRVRRTRNGKEDEKEKKTATKP